MKTKKSTAHHARQFVIFLLLGSGLAAGCGRAQDKAPEITAVGFRADPSKMTPAEKSNLDKLMSSAGKPPAGLPPK